MKEKRSEHQKKVETQKSKKSVKAPKEKKPTDKLADKTATTKFLQHIFGDAQKRNLRRLRGRVAEINKLSDKYTSMSKKELQEQTEVLKKRLSKLQKQNQAKIAAAKVKAGKKSDKKSDKTTKKVDPKQVNIANTNKALDQILPDAFALVREASERILKMRPFDVQLIGGIALHEGNVAEMKTGEGKTLVATLPVYLNALTGRGVHVVTVNDYLAQRDAGWMGELYNFLGLSVGVIINEASFVYDAEYENEDHDDPRFKHLKPATRKEAYLCDVTYGTNNEFGFDYLRDNMVTYEEELIQRELNFAIVDEVDSILIDEARTPLIISGQGVDSSGMYVSANSFVKTLLKDTDYKIDEKDNQISLTDEGVAQCEQYFDIQNFSDPDNMELNHYVNQALRANYLMKRDVDYIVQDGEILIVDEFTGRLMYGRRFSNGLHQAIEAKEGVNIRAESKTLATITLQNYFRMYQKLSGMTGTAKTEEDEFRDIYNMDVVVVPTNLPIARVDKQDAVYAHESGKYAAIVNRVAEVHEKGQPVLVGTISVEISELISQQLKKRGIKHNVLNAKHHEREAEIVAEAGRLGAVTIATNMAGRGTDIILGGNPEFEARKEMKRREYTPEQLAFMTGITKSEDPELNEARDTYKKLCKEYEAERKPEQEKVKELGGLCIIGTERHESRRIDNQLRGRAGRQGDPGESQFFISLEDDLMRLFGGEKMQRLVERVGLEDDEAIEAGMLSKSIENAQKKVEGKNFGIRKYVLQYDNVMNKQREIIYGQRRMVLDGVDLKEYILGMMGELVDGIVDPVTMESKYPEEWDFDRIYDALDNITPRYREAFAGYTDEEKLNLDGDSFKDDLKQAFEKVYDAKEAEIGSEQMREVERMIMLRVVDNRWMDHIDAMDQLKTGIGLRGLGQQDPAMAYASEGFSMFEEMISDIREEVVKYCYNVTVTTRTERTSRILSQESSKAEYRDEDTANGPDAAPEEEKHQETVHRKAPKVGRNDPCPCGSGKKYKNCCGRNA